MLKKMSLETITMKYLYSNINILNVKINSFMFSLLNKNVKHDYVLLVINVNPFINLKVEHSTNYQFIIQIRTNCLVTLKDL